MSYPMKYRKRVIEYLQEGHTQKEAKEIFQVSISTIREWTRRAKEGESLEPKKYPGVVKKIDPEKLKLYVQEHPDAYESEIAEEFNCSTAAISKALKRLKITRKKKTLSYKEQKPEKVKEYLEKIKDIPKEEIAYVDESGIDTYLHREYGYAPVGQKVYGLISGKKYKRTSIVAAKAGKKIISPLQYNGTMNATLFEMWFEKCLLPCLEKGATIVMDNASFHRKKQLFEIAQKQGFNLIFLPPYSPELNPIEKYWAWLKKYLKKILYRFSSFDDALTECFKVN